MAFREDFNERASSELASIMDVIRDYLNVPLGKVVERKFIIEQFVVE